jgi:hypothetical protein
VEVLHQLGSSCLQVPARLVLDRIGAWYIPTDDGSTQGCCSFAPTHIDAQETVDLTFNFALTVPHFVHDHLPAPYKAKRGTLPAIQYAVEHADFATGHHLSN